MSEDRDTTPAERAIARSREDDRGMGPLSQRSLERQRTVEGYLRTGFKPRYMERLQEIHAGIERHRRELAVAYGYLREDWGHDAEGFARAWRERVARWSFDDVNDLVRQHNEWYPVERQLPMDPRTRDYVLIAGRSYRREELTPEWALAQFPPDGVG
jgi:hypothetical protein